MLAAVSPNRSRSRQKRERKAHNWEGKGGRNCLPFSKAGNVYLYIDDAEIRQVCYEIFVSKKSWKRRECASPATIPHSDVIQKKDRYSIWGVTSSVLRGATAGTRSKRRQCFAWTVGQGRKGNLKERLKERKRKDKERRGLMITRERGDKAKHVLFVEARVVGDPRIFGMELEYEALTRRWHWRWTRWGAARRWMATMASGWGGDGNEQQVTWIVSTYTRCSHNAWRRIHAQR